MKSAICLAMTLAASPAFAADGNQILKDVDAAMNAFEDMKLTYEMLDKQPGRDERKMAIEVFIKGDQRLTEFTKPADMKGTKVLVKSSTQMYVYVPAFRKVRRIASHVTNQGFMGMAYSNDDIALNRFTPQFTGKLLSEDDSTWTIEAKAKDGDAPYAKIKIVVDKKMHQPVKLDYFNEDGKLIKTETRKNFDCEGKVCSPGEMKMVDHRADGHYSRMILKTWKVNPGLSSRLFTKRALQRAR